VIRQKTQHDKAPEKEAAKEDKTKKRVRKGKDKDDNEENEKCGNNRHCSAGYKK